MQTRSRPPVEVQPENQNKGNLSDFDCGMVVTETTDLLGFFPTKIIFSIYKKMVLKREYLVSNSSGWKYLAEVKDEWPDYFKLIVG